MLIAGAGEVGFLVANELYRKHDVTVIDSDPSACNRLSEMDVKVQQGNAANAQLLIEAGIKNADVVLALTGNDEVNILICIIASRMGVVQTMARVSNPEYTDRPVQDRKEIGISYMICPELVMAEEMVRALYFPSMLMNRELADGEAGLIEVKVDKEMPLIGKVDGTDLPEHCNIMAINRTGEISLPQEGDALLPNDRVILICDTKALPDLKSMLHDEPRSSKALIVGGGMVGFYLARRLEAMDFHVKLIEKSTERCREISDKLENTMILNSDGTDISLLTEEGAGDMDVVFAVTGKDEKNLLCSLLARQLGAKKIFSRVNRSSFIKLFELVGVDRAVSPGQVATDAVLRRVIGDGEAITLSGEQVELVDFIARDGARVIGKKLSQELPKGAVP
ncbi:MAG: Trk system potassium transporter TrkA, partial [Methanotrichaceae archaeon]|nr:Trk system potassium transporter TrkA [Methanotrichaceae archaeon]